MGVFPEKQRRLQKVCEVLVPTADLDDQDLQGRCFKDGDRGTCGSLKLIVQGNLKSVASQYSARWLPYLWLKWDQMKLKLLLEGTKHQPWQSLCCCVDGQSA